MRIKIKEFRAFLNKCLQEAIAIHNESVSREKRREYGYTNEDPNEYDDLMEVEQIPEDADRVRRHKDGYGDDLEEVDEPTKKLVFNPQNSQDNTAVDVNPEKKAEKMHRLNSPENQAKVSKQLRGAERQAQHMASQEPLKFKFTKSPTGDFSLSKLNQTPSRAPTPEEDAAMYDKFRQKEAVAGAVNPQLKPQPAQASAALHARDKSQMKGVGPRPSMANAFEPIGRSTSRSSS